MRTKLAIALFLTLSLTPAFSLPVGDPRTPEIGDKTEIPVEQAKHEVSLHVFMGASKIDYPDMSGTQFSPGFGAAFTYSYYFNPKWSFMVGGGIQLFNNRGTDVDGNFDGVLEDADDFADDMGNDKVWVYYDFQDYTETQWSLMIMVPVMFQYLSNETRNKAFYYALGAKVGIPFAGSYRGNAKKSKVCGYYPGKWGDPEPGYNFNDCNREGFGEGYENLGFGEYGEVSSYSKLKLSTALFAAAEAGVKWRLYKKLAVYTGFWLDWGLNDIAIRSVTERPISWHPTKGENAEGDKTPKGEISFRSRTNGMAIPVSLGFTVRFAFGAGSHYDQPDSLRWIREIVYRDSLLDACNARARAADSLELYKRMADDLMDSLIQCRNECRADTVDRAALRRHLDSLERARLADLEKKRLADSLERAKRLEAERADRLKQYRDRLSSLTGLDDYKVTQTVPSERAAIILDTAAVLMKDYPDLRLRLTGHTCDKGTHETNVRTGKQRAESAKSYLVSKGIDPSRLETATKAALEPVVPNTSEANRRKNRRVQIEILEGGDNKIQQEAR